MANAAEKRAPMDFLGRAALVAGVPGAFLLAACPMDTAAGDPVNGAPVAVDDFGTTAEDVALLITDASLSANDTDPQSQALSVTAVGSPTNGSVALAAGTVTFTPAADFAGVATFDYTVSDGTDMDTGTVTVTVTAVNDAPVAVDDSVGTSMDTPAVIAGATLTGNDSDVDGPGLSVSAVANPAHGVVALLAGSVTFTPDAGFTGFATFEYTVSDGTLTATGQVTVTVS